MKPGDRVLFRRAANKLCSRQLWIVISVDEAAQTCEIRRNYKRKQVPLDRLEPADSPVTASPGNDT